MHDLDSSIKHPRTVEAKMAKAKREPDFNEEVLDVLVSCDRRHYAVLYGDKSLTVDARGGKTLYGTKLSRMSLPWGDACAPPLS